MSAWLLNGIPYKNWTWLMQVRLMNLDEHYCLKVSKSSTNYHLVSNTVKCHYNTIDPWLPNRAHIMTCPHDRPRVAQHMGKRCEIMITVWSAAAAMTPLCSHTNGIKQRYPTCWSCQYSRFMIDLRSNTLIIHLRCSENATIRPIWLLDARMLKTILVAIKLT